MCEVSIQDGDLVEVLGVYEEEQAMKVAQFFCDLFEGEYEIVEEEA